MKNTLPKGGFAQTIGSKDKMRTFHMGHDEDINYNCTECNKKISAHNKDWHEHMCDECFYSRYFPEEAQIFETNLAEIGKITKRQEKENRVFWKWLKEDELDFERFNKIVKEVTGKIDCTKCSNCCKVISPALKEEDIRRVSEKLNISKGELIKKYSKTGTGDILFNLPCPFLEENRCSIYDARPKDCKEFPNLDKDISCRCRQFFSDAEICPIVFNVLQNAKIEFEQELYEFKYLGV